MTLRQLWWMATGRLENQRGLLLSHGWVIGLLFGDASVSEAEIDSFLRFGIAASQAEPRSAAVDEKAAEILRTGKVSF